MTTEDQMRQPDLRWQPEHGTFPPSPGARRFHGRRPNACRATPLSAAVALGLLIGVVAAANAAPAPDAAITVQSKSGQFVVRGVPPALVSAPSAGAAAGAPAAGTNRVELNPSLLAVSCERIKQALLWELDAPDRWQGKVYVHLAAPGSGDRPVSIAASPFADGWKYQLGVPNPVEPAQVVRAVVQVLLLEMAQRSAPRPAAEPPRWLVEGLARLLTEARQAGLVVEHRSLQPLADQRWWLGLGQAGTTRLNDPLKRVRAELAAKQALTFEQLSFPTAAEAHGDGARFFETCALLFVHDLLQLPNGAASMRDWLAKLSGCLNWQTAFLDAFRDRFATLLDVEKWWALRVVACVATADQGRSAREVSLRRLEEILSATALLPLSTNELPARSAMSLQAVIAEWDFSRQRPALEAKLAQLQLLRSRVHPDVLPLVDEYYWCLFQYLDRRARAGYAPATRHPVNTPAKVIEQATLRRLDELDTQRRALGQQAQAPAQSNAATVLTNTPPVPLAPP